jgi:hypothetical protein
MDELDQMRMFTVHEGEQTIFTVHEPEQMILSHA